MESYRLHGIRGLERRSELGSRLFRRLEAAALTCKDPVEALAWAECASRTAWYCHPGFFAAPALEKRVANLGWKLSGHVRPLSLFPGGRPGILHVLTEAYGTGGHTRMVRQWIANDPSHEHAVVLTRQMAPFQREFVSMGGEMSILDLRAEGLDGMSRFQTLLGAMLGAEKVVLHIHPDDSLSVAAAHAASSFTPILFLNHADHVFWLGANLPGRFIHIRQSSVRLTKALRNPDAKDLAILPIPVQVPREVPDPKLARKNLGIPEEAIVLLTIASGYKFNRQGSWGFSDLVEQALNNPRVHLLVVGPDESHPEFQKILAKAGSRVRLFGIQTDLSIYRAAADIYLDSFPFASLTAALESLVMGAPFLALTPYTGFMSVLGSDSPGLDESKYRCSKLGEFEQRLEQMIQDPSERRSQGQAMMEGTRINIGEAWSEELQKVYDSPGLVDSSRLDSTSDPWRLALTAQETVDPFAAFPGADARKLGIQGYLTWLLERRIWISRHA